MAAQDVMRRPPAMPELSGAQVKEKGAALAREFKQFMLRGNVVDLAIAVVIAAAFGAVVSALVEDLITPLIAAIGGKPDFAGLTFTINHSVFKYGDLLNKLISFITIGAVVFFFIVKPLNRFTKPAAKPAAPKTATCPECLSEIPIGAHRCAHCTSVIAS